MTTQTLTLRLPKRLPWQNKIVSEAKRFNVVDIGRRAGKTTLGIDRCATRETFQYPVGWFSPSYKMLLEVWREACRILEPITSRKSVQDHRIEFITGGLLEFWSLDNPDVARGRKYKRIIVDEAAMVPSLMDAWNYVLRPTLTDYTGDAYFLSTPKGRNGFWQMYNYGIDPDSKEWTSWQMSSYVNDKIDASEFDAMRDTLPELVYKQEILAEFLDGAGAVFRNILACTNAPEVTPEAHKGHTFIAGIDWGKQNDFTTISIGCLQCKCEVDRDRFNQIDYTFQRDRLRVLCDKWKPRTILAESNSIGEPNLEMLQREGLPVKGFATTGTSKPPLIENLALALEREEWQFQSDPVWTAELEAYERKVSPTTGRSQYNAPSGGHDDTVIARCLMVWQAMNQMPTNISIGSMTQSSKWRS
ncbi:MAG TPA: terminase family protein [Pseudomonadales bacterium]|nr:terminase family protein [Pseudomonadales bacterium]